MKESLFRSILLLVLVVCSACLVNSQMTMRLERPEGLKNVIIDCQFTTFETTPTWIIDGIIYYITRLPPQFIQLPNGDLEILMIDSSLNLTTLQCIVPFKNQNHVGDITLLIVTENGDVPVIETLPQEELPQVVIDHQRSEFRDNSYVVSWNTLNNVTCTFYQLDSTDSCQSDQNLPPLLNREQIKHIALNTSDLVDDGNQLRYFNITASDSEEKFCFSVERFQIDTNAITNKIETVLLSRRCPTCIDIPPMNAESRGSLVIALPVSPSTVQTSPDLLCPLNVLMADGCVDLHSCDRFSSTFYNETLTVCMNESLQMCFWNFPKELNRTKVFLFYSNTLCVVQAMPQTTRQYIRSYELLTEVEHGNFSVNISDHTVCVNAEQSECHSTNDTLFNVTLSNTEGCELYRKENIQDSSCITVEALKLVDCFPLIVDIRTDNPVITYQPEIRSLAKNNSSVTSMCECLKSKVEVDFNPNEISKSMTTINVQFACNSSICDRMLQLTLQAENEVIRQTFVFCSTTSILLEGLTCGTNYSITVSVVPDQTQPECILRRRFASTESCGGSNTLTVIIAVVVPLIIIIIVVILVVVLVVVASVYKREMESAAAANNNEPGSVGMSLSSMQSSNPAIQDNIYT